MLTVGVRAHDYGRDTPQNLFSRISQDGYRAAMLAFQKAIEGVSSYYDVTSQTIEETKRGLQTNGITVRTLGVYMELGMADETLRRQAVEQFLRGLETARQMGVPTVATETTPLHKQPGVRREEATKSLYRSLEEILPVAEEKRIQVCVEPVFYHTLNTPEMAAQLLRDMQSPWLQITFDAVNLFDVIDEKDQRSLWDRAFYCFGDAIQVVHMKGIRVEGGVLVRSGFEQSVIDYPYLFRQLSRYDRPLHVIREEADPSRGKEERAFLEELCERYQ